MSLFTTLLIIDILVTYHIHTAVFAITPLIGMFKHSEFLWNSFVWCLHLKIGYCGEVFQVLWPVVLCGVWWSRLTTCPLYVSDKSISNNCKFDRLVLLIPWIYIHRSYWYLCIYISPTSILISFNFIFTFSIALIWLNLQTIIGSSETQVPIQNYMYPSNIMRSATCFRCSS